ncbi:hypothetical protein MMC15_004285 [Xylographa vitiligo]|nr:hypothetical protein [Xylographa vitiligo]
MATNTARRPATQKDTLNKHVSPNGPDDKVKTEFDIFVNKTDKHIMVLQFPNRDRKQPYNARSGQKPLRLRIKPKSGLVEVDVPLVIERHYDRVKGAQYGDALRKSRVMQQGNSYGLAGGLGVNGAIRPLRDTTQASAARTSEDDLQENPDAPVNEDRVMNKLILGGRIIKPQNGKPNYYIGVFKGKELHLTRVSAFCSLTPQFHHLDAMIDNERASTRALREAENPPPEMEARAVNMAVKSNDNEELDMGQIAKELRDIDEEPWQELEWIDEDDTRAFETYEEQLILDKAHQETQLVSAMTKQQYLDALSAPRVDPTKQGKKVMMNRPHSDDESSDEATGDEENARQTEEPSASKNKTHKAAGS